MSQIAVCLKAASRFLISDEDAIEIATKQIAVIQDRWAAVCDEAELSEVDRNLLWRRQFLNPFAFEGAPSVVKLGDPGRPLY
jgi:serine/threonine-protein kinase HipA